MTYDDFGSRVAMLATLRSWRRSIVVECPQGSCSGLCPSRLWASKVSTGGLGLAWPEMAPNWSKSCFELFTYFFCSIKSFEPIFCQCQRKNKNTLWWHSFIPRKIWLHIAAAVSANAFWKELPYADRFNLCSTCVSSVINVFPLVVKR